MGNGNDELVERKTRDKKMCSSRKVKSHETNLMLNQMKTSTSSVSSTGGNGKFDCYAITHKKSDNGPKNINMTSLPVLNNVKTFSKK